MKKRVSFFAVLLAVLTMLVPNVSAKELKETKDVKFDIPFTNGKAVFEGYDETNNINYYKMVIKVNGEVKNTVLSQHPGNPSSQASLGSFYYGVYPQLNGTLYQKLSTSYTDGNVIKAKEALDKEIVKEDSVDYTGFWPIYIRVQYKDGKEWKNVTDKGDGTVTIGQNLKRLLSLENESELVYGENYRFYMNEDRQMLVGWKYTDEEKTEYINFSYDVSFPISARNGNDKYYFPTLEEALASEFSVITVSEDVTIENDLEIEDGKKVIVADGVTVTVASGKTLTNKGSIDNDGTIAGAIVNDGAIYNAKTITGTVVNNGMLQSFGTITGNVTNTGRIYNAGKVDGDVVSDGSIYNVGTITGTVENSDGATLYKIQLPKETEAGGIDIYSNMATAGEKVTLYPYLNSDGYEYKNLKAVYTKNGKDVEIKLTKKTENGDTYYEFEMPAGNVKVTASIEKIKNPETYDGILGYCVTGVISVLGLVALVIATKYSKKEN